jgi:hypothetical protein
MAFGIQHRISMAPGIQYRISMDSILDSEKLLLRLIYSEKIYTFSPTTSSDHGLSRQCHSATMASLMQKLATRRGPLQGLNLRLWRGVPKRKTFVPDKFI